MAKKRTCGTFFDTLERTRIIIDPTEMICAESALVMDPFALGLFMRLLPYVAGRAVPNDFRSMARLAGAASQKTMRKFWPQMEPLFRLTDDGRWTLRQDIKWIALQSITGARQDLRHLLDRLIEHWGAACAYCGQETGSLQIEHIIPRARGGNDDITNLTLACQACNSKKRTKTAAEFGHPHIHDMAARIQ